MILSGDPSTGKSGAGTPRLAPCDPRIDAFHALLAAIDTGRAREGIEATRRLRALGLSVCILPPRGQGGGR